MDEAISTSAEIMRGGLVGAGVWSAVQLSAWTRVRGAEIVALCDRHPERSGAIASRFGITRTYQRVEDMLQAERLDFIDICTRPASHASLIASVSRTGLPILCQKPFCANLEEASATEALARRAGVRIMINENWRWQAWHRQARSCLDSGILGVPFLARIHKRVRMTLPDFTHPQAYLAGMPRLVVYEMGVHYLDTFRFLFGDPQRVYARLHHVSPHVRGEDVQVILLEYPAMTALIQTSWASVPIEGLDTPALSNGEPSPSLLEIDGTAGTLALTVDRRLLVRTDQGEQRWDFSSTPLALSRVAAQQHFADCVRSGTQFETTAADNLRTMALVYGAYESATTGHPVDIALPPVC